MLGGLKQGFILVNEDIIVGNILANTRSQGIIRISIIDIVQIVSLADEMSDRYDISLSHRSVYDFLYNYPFFDTLKGDSLVEINQDTKEDSWRRCFRVDFYTSILLALEQASPPRGHFLLGYYMKMK